MPDQIFPEGIRLFNPRQGQPDFVLGEMVISIDQFKKYFDNHPEYVSKYQGQDQMRFQILRAIAGPIYLAVNTYGTEAGTESVYQSPGNIQEPKKEPLAAPAIREPVQPANNFDESDDDLPF